MNKSSISKPISKIEHIILGWLKPLPRLPKNVTKWISENVWWGVMIAMILTILGGLLAFWGISAYLNFVGNASSYIGIYNVVTYSNLWLFYTVLTLLFAVIMVYLYAKAITPLRMLKAAGWRTLFIIFLVGALRTIISVFIDSDVATIIFNLIFNAIGLAVGAYLLFEIRSYFIKE